jgi:hypothetical protein
VLVLPLLLFQVSCHCCCACTVRVKDLEPSDNCPRSDCSEFLLVCGRLLAIVVDLPMERLFRVVGHMWLVVVLCGMIVHGVLVPSHW